MYHLSMPQFADFEEKEFEGPLNSQLCLGGPHWPPGQVLEAVVGFDAALLVQDSLFWALHGFATPPGGAAIRSSWWPSFFARVALAIKSPPPFRLNLFLQHKRPEYLHGKLAKEWNDWGQPYYRFWTTAHQQAALESCALALGSHGLVAYACPAFHLRAALFHHIEHRTLRSNTHFAPASLLRGHERYTYVDALTQGKAHSTIEEVEPLRFLSGDNGGSPPRVPLGGNGGRSPGELLADARRAAEAALRAGPALVGGVDAHREVVRRATAILPSELPQANRPPVSREDESVQNFIFTAAFASMSRVAWVILS